MKFLILTLAVIAGSFSLRAQCVPDTSVTHGVPGIYPDSATGLPHGVVNVPYGTTIQLRVPTDTVYLGFPATITSITITGITGLPPGFSYVCNPASCVFNGGTDACVYIQGPAMSSPGVYPFIVNMDVLGEAFGIPQTIQETNDNYAIVIDATSGIATVTQRSFNAGQNYPNPASRETMIPVTLTSGGNVSIIVSDLIGKKVMTKNINLGAGEHMIPLDISKLKSGIYVYSVTFGTGVKSRRMIVAND